MKKKTTVKITVWTAVLAAAAVGIWLTVRPSGGGDITLQTAVAARGDIRNSVTATGTVEPVTLVEVGTQVSGIIDRLYVDYNDRVTAGQLIAEMDKVTLESDLEEAEAQLASSKTEYEYRMKEYLRTKQLYDKELVSDAEYDEALYLYETARNTYAQRQASIVGIRRNLGYATITSPIDGVVISRLRDPDPLHDSQRPDRHAGDSRCGRGRHRLCAGGPEGGFHSGCISGRRVQRNSETGASGSHH